MQEPRVGTLLRRQFGADTAYARGDIRQFNRRNGIVNDMIHGVLDAHGCIWLSTNKGLARYGPCHDFPQLLLLRFASSSSATTLTGNVPYSTGFFGGVNGVVWMNPAAEPPSFSTTNPGCASWISNCRTEHSCRCRIIRATDGPRCVLRPRCTTGFAVSFVAVDYLNGDNYEYSHHAGGLFRRVGGITENNRVAFMNIPAGGLLHVRYKSNVMDRAAPRSTRCPDGAAAVVPHDGSPRVLYPARGRARMVFAALLRRHYRAGSSSVS